MKQFVVTGGSSGIGQALACHLAKLGHQVLVCGRRGADLQETKKMAPEHIDFVVGDLIEKNTIEAIKEQLQGRPIAGLIQAAAIITPIAELKKINVSDLRATFDINFFAPLNIFQALAEQLSGGKVLHLSTAAAHQPFTQWGAYCTSKAALYMLYMQLKKEYPMTAFGSVMPGITDTHMVSQIRQSPDLNGEAKTFFDGLFDTNRLLSPKVVAEFLSWLLLEVEDKLFQEKEWDIYEEAHHHHWLTSGAVPDIGAA